MAYLTLHNGPQAGRLHPLKQDRSVLGRHPDCDVIVEVGAVSRHHAQVEKVGNDFFVEDLDSRNGTYVNEQIVRTRHLLTDGDLIRVCDVSFVFHAAEEAVGPSNLPAHGLSGSSVAVLVDDVPSSTGNSTIMSRLEVSSHDSSTFLTSSVEAKLGALLEITRSLGKALALDEVLPQVLHSLFKIFLQADRGFVALLGEDGVLIPRWTKVRREGLDDTIRVSKTIVNQVVSTKEAILSADAISDSRFQMSESIADFRIRSMICAPLVDTEGNCLGVLQIDTMDQRHRFREEDLEVLASVATAAAVAIHNAQLHENALRQRDLERDLQLAHQVQHGFLPQLPPQLPGYEFYDYYRPADQIGGDYFDYIPLPDQQLAIIVADVVGHGIAAALLMAKLSAAVRACLAAEPRVGAALTRLNQMLNESNVEDRFVTLVMCVLHPGTHQLTVANAGHMAPLIRRSSGLVEAAGAEIANLPLGVAEGITYEQFTTHTTPGDVVLMYTDGLNESMNRQGEFYGNERLRKLFTACDSVPSAGKRLIDDVYDFAGGQAPVDDMCLVCCGRT